jgi:Delta3-Delta2-enoyl-CoA isomerase
VAAIRGACPAGGCIIALCCDYRIMTEVGIIGLNEVALGITVPKYWGKLMVRTVGPAKAEQLLTTGALVSSVEAKAMGMVDEIVSPANLLGAAAAASKRLARIPAVPRSIVKQDFRKEFAEEWFAFALQEPDSAWPFLSQPSTVKMLAATLERLSKGRSKL